MDTKIVYLTIDDFPSAKGLEKIHFLRDENIPAVIYARGECLENHWQAALEAIKLGYLIGNHSYHHPYFSKLSAEECRKEIDQTEFLIDEAYRKAGQRRATKTIRFPYGDPAPYEIEDYLKEKGFKKAILPPDLENHSFSVPWTIDTLDYKVRLTRQPKLLREKLTLNFNYSKNPEEIVMLHDFEHNQNAFFEIIDFFKQEQVLFRELSFYDE